MRADKELLKLMVQNKDKFRGGIMGWLRGLLESNLISQEEYIHLGNYMNKPVEEYKAQLSDAELLAFNEYGNLEARLEFIQKEIQKLDY
jgi:hypothetical protein